MSEAAKLKNELTRLSEELNSADRIKTEAKLAKLTGDLSSALAKLAETNRKKRASSEKAYKSAVSKAEKAAAGAVKETAESSGKAYAEGESDAKASRLENVYSGVTGRRAAADEAAARENARLKMAELQNELKDYILETEADKKAAAAEQLLTLEELEKQLSAEKSAAEESYRARLRQLLADTSAKVTEEREEKAAKEKAAALAAEEKKTETKQPAASADRASQELSDTELRDISRDIVSRATYKGYTYPDLIKKEYSKLAEGGSYSASELERLRKLLML